MQAHLSAFSLPERNLIADEPQTGSDVFPCWSAELVTASEGVQCGRIVRNQPPKLRQTSSRKVLGNQAKTDG